MENVKNKNNRNVKTLKLVVCMSLIVALAISALSFSVRATYENTHGNTGNQASDIVGIATTQVGYGEGGDGYTKYGDWYGLPYSDWCAMFVSWCANQAGVSTDVFPSFALCSAGADWFISQGRFQYAGSYTPQAGDLIFYSSYGDIYHVGLVTGSDGYNVYSIEGNYCEAVYNVSYPLSYGDILGYATPNYELEGQKQTVETMVQTAEETQDDVSTEDEEELIDTEEVYVDSEEEYTETAAVSDETDSDEEYTEVTDEDSESDEDNYTDDDNSTEADSETDEEISTEEDTDTTEVTVDTEITEDTDTEDTDTAVAEDTEDDTTDEDKPSVISGDVNGDGVVDSTDALLIQRYLAQKLTDTEEFNFLGADADADGEITVHDALYVLEMSVSA